MFKRFTVFAAGLIEQRAAKGNQIRGLVCEYGLVAPRELSQLRRAIPLWREDAHNGLSERFRRLLNALWCDLRTLDERVAELDREIMLIAQSDPAARRLQQLCGVGPIIASALVAAVGDGAQYANGRQMAAVAGATGAVSLPLAPGAHWVARLRADPRMCTAARLQAAGQ